MGTLVRQGWFLLILHIGWAFAHSTNIYVLKMPTKQPVAQSHNYGRVQRC